MPNEDDEVERTWLASDYHYRRLSDEAKKAIECFRPLHTPCAGGCTNLTTLKDLGLVALDSKGNLVPSPKLLTAIAAETEWDQQLLDNTLMVGRKTWQAFREDVQEKRLEKMDERAQAENEALNPTGVTPQNNLPQTQQHNLPQTQQQLFDNGSTSGTDAGVQFSVGDSVATNQLAVHANAIQGMLNHLLQQNTPATGTATGGASTTGSTGIPGSMTGPGRPPFQTEIVSATLWQFWGEEDASAKDYLAPEALIREVENRRVRMFYTERDCVNFFRSSLAGKAAQWFFGLWSSTKNYSNICIDDWEGLKRAFRSRYGYGDSMYHVDFKELIVPKGNESPTTYISRFRQGIDEFMNRFGKRIFRDAFPKRDYMLLNNKEPPANVLKNAYFRFPREAAEKLAAAIVFLTNLDHSSPAAFTASLNRFQAQFLEMLETACITYATAFLDASLEDFLDEAKQRYEWWECISFLHSDKLREWSYTYVRQNYEKPKAERPTNIDVWNAVTQKERSLKDPKIKPPMQHQQHQATISALEEMSASELRQLLVHVDAASANKQPRKHGKDKKKGRKGGKPGIRFQPGSGPGKGKYCSHCNKKNHSTAECWAKNKHTSDGRLITGQHDSPPAHLRTAAVTSEQYGGSDGGDRAQQRFTLEECVAAGWVPPQLSQRR